MSRLLIVFLGLFFFVFIGPVLSEEADPAAVVVKELAEFLKGQDPKLSFSHRASGGMHGSLFTTSKGDITITVYRNSGLWQVVSVDFKP